jgi:NADPH-dependent 2,4-dienoyl-CoA reductase/sulfur reductase-like enzyme
MDRLPTGSWPAKPCDALWHHACFDLSSGEALRAPALSPVECWKVDRGSGKIFVKEKRAQVKPRRAPMTNGVGRIVIVGGGAAGFAAAEMLRRRGFGGARARKCENYQVKTGVKHN